MKTWEIWCEGYNCSGLEGQPEKANFFGVFEGETFRDACDNWVGTISEPELYDRERLTYWACRLFNNETDARKSFG